MTWSCSGSVRPGYMGSDMLVAAAGKFTRVKFGANNITRVMIDPTVLHV